MNTFRKLTHNEVEKESLQKSAENVLICTPPPDSENIRTYEVDINDEKKSKSQIQYVKSLLIDPFTEEDLTRIYTKITGNTELENF